MHPQLEEPVDHNEIAVKRVPIDDGASPVRPGQTSPTKVVKQERLPFVKPHDGLFRDLTREVSGNEEEVESRADDPFRNESAEAEPDVSSPSSSDSTESIKKSKKSKKKMFVKQASYHYHVRKEI